jgi:hypothetical protein
MCSHGTGYLMPRGSNSWPVHRASVTEQPAPGGFSASPRGRILTAGFGAAWPIGASCHRSATRRPPRRGRRPRPATVNRRGDLHELRLIRNHVAHLCSRTCRSRHAKGPEVQSVWRARGRHSYSPTTPFHTASVRGPLIRGPERTWFSRNRPPGAILADLRDGLQGEAQDQELGTPTVPACDRSGCRPAISPHGRSTPSLRDAAHRCFIRSLRPTLPRPGRGRQTASPGSW